MPEPLTDQPGDINSDALNPAFFRFLRKNRKMGPHEKIGFRSAWETIVRSKRITPTAFFMASLFATVGCLD